MMSKDRYAVADMGQQSASDAKGAELLPRSGKATPGGSLMPAADYSKSLKRGNGRGQAIG